MCVLGCVGYAVWTDAEDTFSSKAAETKGQYLFSGQQEKETELVEWKGGQCHLSCEHYLPKEAGTGSPCPCHCLAWQPWANLIL